MRAPGSKVTPAPRARAVSRRFEQLVNTHGVCKTRGGSFARRLRAVAWINLGDLAGFGASAVPVRLADRLHRRQLDCGCADRLSRASGCRLGPGRRDPIWRRHHRFCAGRRLCRRDATADGLGDRPRRDWKPALRAAARFGPTPRSTRRIRYR
jgi:hypothetical protein